MSFERTGGDLTRRPVMVVDDDHQMRALLRDVLEDEGYTVHEARDGQVALDLLQQTTERWVVLTDHLMPRLNGYGLIAAVLADSQLRTRHTFVYMTAADRSLELNLQLLLESVQVPILRKPFALEVGVAAVTSAAERLANATS
jgi:CheY-like chemotaxis protein